MKGAVIVTAQVEILHTASDVRRLVRSLRHLTIGRGDSRHADVCGEASRVLRSARASGTPFEQREPLDLRKVEIDRVMKPIAALSAREPLRDVADVVEVQVVEHDELGIACGDHILLEIVGTESVGQSFADQRVLGQVATRAAVGDDDGAFGHGRRGSGSFRA